MAKVFVIEGSEHSYEPINWLYPKCYRKAAAAHKEVERLLAEKRRVDDELVNFKGDNDEPNIDTDEGCDAWTKWMDAQRDIRKTHPDENTHDIHDYSYGVTELEMF